MTKKSMKQNGMIVLEMNLKNGFFTNKVTILLSHKMIFVNILILKRPPEPPRIEFEFYTPNGEEHQVTFFNNKYFFIDDEENYEKIYKSITSKI